MGQTVFLLFDPSARLVQTRTTAATTGAVDPYSMFFKPGDTYDGFVALEVDPRIVTQIRPEVWVTVSGHASLIAAKGEGLYEILVDEIEEIVERKRENAIQAAEGAMVDFACLIATLRGAHDILGDLPEGAQRQIANAEEGIGRCRKAAANLRSGEEAIPIGKIHSDLAGKRLPIQ